MTLSYLGRSTTKLGQHYGGGRGGEGWHGGGVRTDDEGTT